MNFATDYITAYQLLRKGVPDDRLAEAIRSQSVSSPLHVKIKEIFKTNYIQSTKILQPANRLIAVFQAIGLAKEMRRQRVLVHTLLDIKENAHEYREVSNRPITLFPITINRTVVQMRDPDKTSND